MTFTLNIKGIWMETVTVEALSKTEALSKAREYIDGAFTPSRENYRCHEITFSPTGETYSVCSGDDPLTVDDWHVRSDGVIVCEPGDSVLHAMEPGETVEWNYPAEAHALHAARRARKISRETGRVFECSLSSNNRKITITRKN